MNGKVTYHQQVSYCGKPQCRKCREGIGHGPYWYAYRTEHGRTTRTYIGKNLPPGVQVTDIQGAEALTHPDPISLRIYTLGQLRVERRDRQGWQAIGEAAFQQQAVRALLGLLVSSPGRRLDREQARAALWPDLEAETADGRLERAAHNLQQIFEPARKRSTPPRLLRDENNALILADHDQVWTDADAFADLLDQAAAHADPVEVEELLEKATGLYSGDFLPEERHISLAITRRERLQEQWRTLLLQLADLRIAREAFTGALEPLDRLLAIDPTNEAAIQRLMRTLARLKRRGEAMRAYQRLAGTLQQTAARTPSEETRSLYEAIRGDEQITKPTPLLSPARQPAASSEQAERETPAPLRPAYRWQTGRSHQNPLVGREAELEVLRQVLRATEHTSRAKPSGQKKTSALPLDTQRRPQYAVLMGGAGLGKTRLAEEISREAQERDWTIIWSRVYAQESTIPYRPWIETLRNMLTNDLWQRQEISKRATVYAPLSALLPELYELFPHPPLLPPEQEQQRLWEAALELFTVMSERAPLLIVLDDLQWADASSCELLTYLVRRLSGHPVMFLGTCRDSELPADHPLRALIAHLHREHGVITLQVQPLSDAQIGTLVAHVPEAMMHYIQTQAAGNPFFAEELARSVEAQFIAPPQIAQRDAVYPLPDTIAAVLNLRISRLSKACQRLLGNAAVLGGSFEFNVISSMESSKATPTDEDIVLDLLDEALQAGVLTEEGSGTRISYHFWHPLLVSHLYDGLSATKRVMLHRRAADTLRRMYAAREEEGAATITHHLVAGGAEPEQVAHYAALAADSAYALSAYPEAERYYRLAVENLEASAQDPQTHLAYLLERLGECLRIRGNFKEARSIYERALAAHLRQLTFASHTDYLYEMQIRALLWSEIAWTWHYTGDAGQAQQHCDRGRQVLRDAGVAGGPAWAKLHYQQSLIYWEEGKYDEARAAAHEALKLFAEAIQRQAPATGNTLFTRTRRTLEGDPVDLGRVHRFLGMLANSVGSPTEALAHLNTALKLLEQHDYKRDIAHTCCNIGHTYLEKAEHELAQPYFQRSLTLAEQLGDTPLVAVIYSNLGELAARVGNLAEAEGWFRRSIAQIEQINDQMYISIWNTHLAAVLQDQGNLSQAGTAIYRSLTIGRAINKPPCIGLALVALSNLRIAQATVIHEARKETGEADRHLAAYKQLLQRAGASLRQALALPGLEAETRTRGELALAQLSLLQGELDSALRQAIHALEGARQYELAWLVARAQSLLGSILAAQGDQEQARQHFEQALQAFQRCGMRLDYARTLQRYGTALLSANANAWEKSTAHEQGLAYLHEARQIFSDCDAPLDLALAERAESLAVW